MDTPVETLLSVALLTPMGNPVQEDCVWGAPMLLWGSPGIGKSDRVRVASHSIGLDVAELFLSTALPEDLSGIRMPDGKGGAFTDFPHLGINRITKARAGVIFVDELTCARPAVQGAGLSLVRDRILANEHLPGGVRVIGAANPPEEAAGGWPLALPMANRFIHFQMPKPSPTEWAAWCIGNDDCEVIQLSDGENDIRHAWPDLFPRYKGLFAGFIQARGADLLLKVPADGHADRGRAWPSPRMWAMARNTACACAALGREELAVDFIAACVGVAPAAEWAEWVSKANMPDAADMLKNGWTPDKRRLDLCFAAYGQAIAWVLAKPNRTKDEKDERAKWAQSAWRLLTSAWKDHGLLDVACSGGVPLIHAGYNTKHSPMMDAAAREIISKFGDQIALYVHKASKAK